jgi:hypothetical protein
MATKSISSDAIVPVNQGWVNFTDLAEQVRSGKEQLSREMASATLRDAGYAVAAVVFTSGCTNMSSWPAMPPGVSPDRRLKSRTMCVWS